jgi:hypothetical protein
VGINIRDDRDPARGYVENYGWTWESLYDPSAELAGALGLPGQPSVAVLDENGVVVARHIGGGDQGAWEALADQL